MDIALTLLNSEAMDSKTSLNFLSTRELPDACVGMPEEQFRPPLLERFAANGVLYYWFKAAKVPSQAAIAMGPTAWTRTTPSSKEQNARTPVVFWLIAEASTLYVVLTPLTGSPPIHPPGTRSCQGLRWQSTARGRSGRRWPVRAGSGTRPRPVLDSPRRPKNPNPGRLICS
jgi:hypothetical protein